MKPTIFALILAGLATTCAAGPDYLNLGGPSWHFDEHGRRAQGFNEANAGLGLTWQDVDAPVLGPVDLSAGFYRNSERSTTAYAMASKLPLDALGARWGLTGGLVTGYDRAAVLPVLAPTACWRLACVLVIPPIKEHNAGAVSVQFRIPL